MKDYLEPFFEDPGNYPVTILLFRDQFHLGQTAEILSTLEDDYLSLTSRAKYFIVI